MPKFDRIGVHILDENGRTIETDINLSNNSHIEIDKGNAGTHFRLKFAMEGGGGWWVDRRALGELITELLYIRREVIERFGEDEELIAPAENLPKIRWKFADEAVEVPFLDNDLA